MPVRFRCTFCQRKLTIGSRKAGLVVPCPICNTPVTVPQPGSPLLCAESSSTGRSGLAFLLLFLTAVVVVPPLTIVALVAIRPDIVGPSPGPTVAVATKPSRSSHRPRSRIIPPGLTAPLESDSEPTEEFLPPRPVQPRAAEQEVFLPPLPPVPPPALDPPAPRPMDDPKPEPPRPRPVNPPVIFDPPEPREKPRPQQTVPLPGVGGRLTVKRRQTLDEETLRKAMLDVPELALDRVPGTTQRLVQTARLWNRNGLPVTALMGELARTRSDLAGLRLFNGMDGQLGKEPAETLQALSRKMRVELEACLPRNGDPRPNPDMLRARLLGGSGEWLRVEAVPAMMQLLQAENKPIRLVLVDMLSRIDRPEATRALALRAMVDLSSEVREAALDALRTRPTEDYSGLLLDGLQYPRREIRDHAAEALIALRCTDTISTLCDLLLIPEPEVPVRVQDGRTYTTVVRELVRVNHLANCVMCHAPSFNRGDLVRGAVPIPGQPLPAPITTPQYYDAAGSVFVRADVTYLRQDFSVMQTVASPGDWPSHQRYDYLVRLRTLSPQETQQRVQQYRELRSTGQRDAVLFALRELTGKDFGDDLTAWQRYVLQNHPPSEESVMRSARRLGDELGRCVPEVRDSLLQRVGEGKGVQYTDALLHALGRVPTTDRAKVRETLVERMTRMTKSTLRQKLEEPNSELRQAAARACLKKDAVEMVPDLIAVLRNEDEAVVRAAHEALTGLTGQDFGPKRNAGRRDRDAAIEDWSAWWNTRKPR